MTHDKVLEVIEMYEKFLAERGIPKAAADLTTPAPPMPLQLAHCNDMLDDMKSFCAQDRLGKAYRWLGFVQGVLWSAGIYTIKEMADHNRTPV